MRSSAHAPIARAVLPLAILWLGPAAARAHEVRHEVARGRAIAVRALEDGEGLAGAPWQVFAPADPARPHQRGRTDARGWLAFVPDAPGQWRVRVVEEGGHGLDVLVDVDEPAVALAAAATSGAAGWQRSMAGLGVVGAAFAALFLGYRRRSRSSGA